MKNIGSSLRFLLLTIMQLLGTQFSAHFCFPFLISSLRSIGEESFAKEVFEEYIVHLQEKAKEKERKREEEKVWYIFLMFD